MTHPTSQQVDIKPRRMAFDTDTPMNKYTFDNNSLVSTFFYALSALFPDGERFFIHSVRNYQDEIEDPVLRQQIRGFMSIQAALVIVQPTACFMSLNSPHIVRIRHNSVIYWEREWYVCRTKCVGAQCACV